MQNEYLNGVGIFIPVSNLEVSTKWYQSMLGFEILHQDEPNANVLKMGNGVVVFCLVTSKNIEQPKFPKNNYNVDHYFNFHTNHVEEIHKQLKNKAAQVSEIHEIDGMKGFRLNDPDGNVFGVIE